MLNAWVGSDKAWVGSQYAWIGRQFSEGDAGSSSSCLVDADGTKIAFFDPESASISSTTSDGTKIGIGYASVDPIAIATSVFAKYVSRESAASIVAKCVSTGWNDLQVFEAVCLSSPISRSILLRSGLSREISLLATITRQVKLRSRLE